MPYLFLFIGLINARLEFQEEFVDPNEGPIGFIVTTKETMSRHYSIHLCLQALLWACDDNVALHSSLMIVKTNYTLS